LRNSNIRFLWPYMSGHPWWFIGSFIYAIAGAGASAFSPFVLGRAIDELSNELRIERVAMWAGLILFLSFCVAVLRYSLRMLTGEMAAVVSYEMSRDMFQRILTFEQGIIREYGVGDLLSRATSDFIYVWRFFSAGFQMFLNAFFLFLIGTSLMATSNVMLAVIVTGMLMLSVVIQLRLGSVLEHSFDRVQQQMARISAYAQERLNVVRMLKAYAQEQAVSAAFSSANDEYTRRNLQFVLRSGAIGPLPGVVVRLATTLVLLVGGSLVISNELSLGDYVQFIVYLGVLGPAAVQMSNAFERLQQGSAAAGRIAAVLRRVPQVANRSDAVDLPQNSTIELKNVGVRAGEVLHGAWSAEEHAPARAPSGDSKTTRRWILHDLNLTIEEGTTVGIVGSTGSGKSTLLGLLLRVQDPDVGSVTFGGVDLRQLKLEELRSAVAYVPQETLLFSMSLRDNITLGLKDVPDEQVMEAMDVAKLTNDLPQLPHGLDTVVGERGASLSGGQRQRTAIARALVRNPRLLILDDALASIDAHTAAAILEGLRSQFKRCTCVIVAQRMASVSAADKIVVLEDGRVAEQGTHAELLALGSRYAEMYRREVMQAEDSLAE